MNMYSQTSIMLNVSIFPCNRTDDTTMLMKLANNTQVSTDIVGNGVSPCRLLCSTCPSTCNADVSVKQQMLAAFFITTMFAIIAVLAAYVLMAVDKSALNFLDKKVIAGVRDLWYTMFRARRVRQDSLASMIGPGQTRGLRREGGPPIHPGFERPTACIRTDHTYCRSLTRKKLHEI